MTSEVPWSTGVGAGCGVTVTVSVGDCGVVGAGTVSVGVCAAVVPGTGVLSVVVLEMGCDACCVGVSAGASGVWELVSAANAGNAGVVAKSIAAEVYTSIFFVRFL
ncbi:MAG: hypothetical protein K2I96_11575 [Lachnospiraceae bacterium]|nr:hypothetical protein [Lachnospiraceae bacterium]